MAVEPTAAIYEQRGNLRWWLNRDFAGALDDHDRANQLDGLKPDSTHAYSQLFDERIPMEILRRFDDIYGISKAPEEKWDFTRMLLAYRLSQYREVVSEITRQRAKAQVLQLHDALTLFNMAASPWHLLAVYLPKAESAKSRRFPADEEVLAAMCLHQLGDRQGAKIRFEDAKVKCQLTDLVAEAQKLIHGKGK